jgi:hypothetical protein
MKKTLPPGIEAPMEGLWKMLLAFDAENREVRDVGFLAIDVDEDGVFAGSREAHALNLVDEIDALGRVLRFKLALNKLLLGLFGQTAGELELVFANSETLDCEKENHLRMLDRESPSAKMREHAKDILLASSRIDMHCIAYHPVHDLGFGFAHSRHHFPKIAQYASILASSRAHSSKSQ